MIKIFQHINRLYILATNSFKWVSAKEKARDRNYKNALEILNSMNIKRININTFVEYLVFKGFIEFYLGDEEESAICFELFFKYIINTDKFTSNEIRYLKAFVSTCYLTYFGAVTIVTTKETLQSHLEYSLINLDCVNNSIQNDFPLRDHPNWKE